MTRFGKCLENQDRFGISKAGPKQSFLHVLSCVCCCKGFPEHKMLVAGYTLLSFPATWEFCKRQKNSICWAEVFFSHPQIQVKYFLHSKTAFELQHLFSPSCFSEETSLRNHPGHCRDDMQETPVLRGAVQWFVGFAQSGMNLHSSKIKSECRLEVSVVGLGLFVTK